jgi:hypothetical protein
LTPALISSRWASMYSRTAASTMSFFERDMK